MASFIRCNSSLTGRVSYDARGFDPVRVQSVIRRVGGVRTSNDYFAVLTRSSGSKVVSYSAVGDAFRDLKNTYRLLIAAWTKGAPNLDISAQMDALRDAGAPGAAQTVASPAVASPAPAVAGPAQVVPAPAAPAAKFSLVVDRSNIFEVLDALYAAGKADKRIQYLIDCYEEDSAR